MIYKVQKNQNTDLTYRKNKTVWNQIFALILDLTLKFEEFFFSPKFWHVRQSKGQFKGEKRLPTKF